MASLNLYWLIVGCEVSFWAVMILGLAARYLFLRKELSRLLLLSLPLIDLALLTFTALDLKAGSPATYAHGLATAYVGFTVAFGKIAVAWADGHFAHWFAGAPAPAKAPTRGWTAIRYELHLWARCLGAVAITLALLVALIAFVNDEAATEPLHVWFSIAPGSAFLWFLFGPVWTAVFSSWRPQR